MKFYHLDFQEEQLGKTTCSQGPSRVPLLMGVWTNVPHDDFWSHKRLYEVLGIRYALAISGSFHTLTTFMVLLRDILEAILEAIY